MPKINKSIKNQVQKTAPDMRITGLEPAHQKILDPKSNASANSAISANIGAIIALLR